LKGEINGFSIGCELLSDPREVCDANGCITYLDKINILEVSICLPPNQMVLCNPEEKEIKDINIGDLVYTHKGNYKPVINKFVRHYDGDLINIKPMFTSDVFSMTTNHPVCVAIQEKCKEFKSWGWINCNPSCKREDCEQKPKEFTRKWVRAEELSKDNHLIAYPINKKILTNDEILSHWEDSWVSKQNYKNGGLKKEQLLNKDFWRLVGYWLAEGSSSIYGDGRHVLFYFGKTEDNLIVDTEKLISTCVKRKFVKTYTQTNTCKLDIPDKAFYDFLQIFKSFPYKRGNKKIPRWVMELPLDFQKELIYGYYMGDKFCSVSKQMLLSIRNILLRFGILLNFGKRTDAGTCVIEGRKCNTQASYSLGSEKSKFLKLMQLPLVHTKKENNLDKWDNDYVYVPIREITRTPYFGDVYNIEVQDDNSYGNDLIMTHNCSKPINKLSGFTVISKSDLLSKDVCKSCNIFNQVDKMVEEPKTETKEEPKELSVEERIEAIERSMFNIQAAITKMGELQMAEEEKAKKPVEEKPVVPPEDEKKPKEVPCKSEEVPIVESALTKKDFDEFRKSMEDLISKSIASIAESLKPKEQEQKVKSELELALKARDEQIENLKKALDEKSTKEKIETITKAEANSEPKTVQDNTDKESQVMLEEDYPIVVSKGTVSSRKFVRS
ncbi:MAG: hypothetical protein IMZ59_03630, partial [Actinobacteria bacterium]|nr:hypothetical protein [Actinomycetota bacterium]